MLTHEPQVTGSVGVELIDLLSTPIQSTIFSLSKGVDFEVKDNIVKCSEIKKYPDLPSNVDLLRAASENPN